MKADEITKNFETLETKPICQKNCRVCSSDFSKEINLLRKDGRRFTEIIDYIKKKYNYNLSKAGLSRHFKNYNNRKQTIAAEIIKKDLIEESTEIARHTSAIISLIDEALKQINDRGIRFDISDLEKLFKIRHQILRGDSSGENELTALFQTAIDKHGVNVNQGILFKK